jgi:hypothetical protein
MEDHKILFKKASLLVSTVVLRTVFVYVGVREVPLGLSPCRDSAVSFGQGEPMLVSDVCENQIAINRIARQLINFISTSTCCLP